MLSDLYKQNADLIDTIIISTNDMLTSVNNIMLQLLNRKNLNEKHIRSIFLIHSTHNLLVGISHTTRYESKKINKRIRDMEINKARLPSDAVLYEVGNNIYSYNKQFDEVLRLIQILITEFDSFSKFSDKQSDTKFRHYINILKEKMQLLKATSLPAVKREHEKIFTLYNLRELVKKYNNQANQTISEGGDLENAIGGMTLSEDLFGHSTWDGGLNNILDNSILKDSLTEDFTGKGERKKLKSKDNKSDSEDSNSESDKKESLDSESDKENSDSESDKEESDNEESDKEESDSDSASDSDSDTDEVEESSLLDENIIKNIQTNLESRGNKKEEKNESDPDFTVNRMQHKFNFKDYKKENAKYMMSLYPLSSSPSKKTFKKKRVTDKNEKRIKKKLIKAGAFMFGGNDCDCDEDDQWNNTDSDIIIGEGENEIRIRINCIVQHEMQKRLLLYETAKTDLDDDAFNKYMEELFNIPSDEMYNYIFNLQNRGGQSHDEKHANYLNQHINKLIKEFGLDLDYKKYLSLFVNKLKKETGTALVSETGTQLVSETELILDDIETLKNELKELGKDPKVQKLFEGKKINLITETKPELTKDIIKNISKTVSILKRYNNIKNDTKKMHMLGDIQIELELSLTPYLKKMEQYYTTQTRNIIALINVLG